LECSKRTCHRVVSPPIDPMDPSSSLSCAEPWSLPWSLASTTTSVEALWASLLLSPPWSTWLSSSENESFDPAALLMLPRLCLLLLLPASVWSPGRFAACTLTPARC